MEFISAAKSNRPTRSTGIHTVFSPIAASNLASENCMKEW